MMMARMKRGSTPLEDETCWIAVLMSADSSGLLFAVPNCVQDWDMIGRLNVHMVSKSTQSDMAGQPCAVVPSPWKNW